MLGEAQNEILRKQLKELKQNNLNVQKQVKAFITCIGALEDDETEISRIFRLLVESCEAIPELDQDTNLWDTHDDE